MSKENKDVEMKYEEKEVSTTQLIIPDFWIQNPELWFTQIESTFTNNKITSENKKFDQVIAKLPPQQVELVADIIIRRDPTLPYTILKEAIVSRNKPNSATQFERLLNEDTMGDRRPSAHYRKVQEIARQCNIIDEKMIKTFWMRALPPEIKAIISVVEDQAVEKLTLAADKAFEMLKPRGSVEEFSEPPITDATLKHLVESITKKVTENLRHEFSKNSRSRSRYRTPTRHVRFRSNSRSSRSSKHGSVPRQANNDDVCYYHKAFGDKAKKCRKFCKYAKSSKN